MQIETPTTTHPVTYYEIISTTGMHQSITIDPRAGDTYQEYNDTIEVVLSAKPSLSDPVITLPAQYILIFKSVVFSIQSWTVEVKDHTPDEQLALVETIKKLTS